MCLKEFQSRGIELCEHFPMRTLCTMRCGGISELAVYPHTAEEFIYVIDTLERGNATYKVVGGMSNVLPPDDHYSGTLVITKKLRGVTLCGGVLRAGAGESLAYLNKVAARLLYSFCPEISGIPGTLGGAVRGNAGAYGKEIADVLISALVYDPRLARAYELTRDELHFGYRSSLLKKKRLYLISAELKLTPSLDALARIRHFAARRRQTQPKEHSLGSVFLRVHGVSAGALLDHAGMKGYTVGGAAVSEVHAGFIVNRRNASSQDVKRLIAELEQRVFALYGIRLECEIDIM